MNEDEVRPADEVRELLARQLKRDPDGLYALYAKSQAEVDRLRSSARAEAAAAEQATKIRSELAQARNKLNAKERALEDAEASLRAYRQETSRLKADLKRVRESRAMRIGKTVLAPARSLSRTASNLRHRGAAETTASKGAPQAPQGVELAEFDEVADQPTVSAHSAHSAPAVRRVGDMSFVELQERFENDPSVKNLGYVLSRAWYSEGSVELGAKMIEKHPDLRSKLPEREAVLADRILGESRLESLAPSLIVPRCRGVLFEPARGRVMYCAHSTPVYNSNGYSTRTRGVVEGLKVLGADVAVVARSGYPWDTPSDRATPLRKRSETVLDGVPYIHTPGSIIGTTPVDRYILEAADTYVREGRRLRPEVIHAASNYITALPALIAARRLGVPFVYEVRGLWEITEASGKEGWDLSERYQLQARMEALVATSADQVLAITEQVKDELVRRGVSAEKVSLLPNGVNTEAFMPIPRDSRYASELGVSSDEVVVGYAGSLVDYEGLDLLIRSLSEMDTETPFKVLIAGSGAEKERLESLADECGVRDRVTLLGRVPASSINRLQSVFDIVCCPRKSQPVTEMVSALKPLEAFSAAKAVILSDVRPNLELAGPDGRRALLHRADDASDLASKLQIAIEDGELRRDLGRAARLWVTRERSWKTIGKTVLAAYKAAADVYASSTASNEKGVSELRIGLISDQFTRETLRESVDVVLVRPGLSESDFLALKLDILLVESAWEGQEGVWRRGVGFYSDAEQLPLRRILSAARKAGVPSVFWNKEDPVHYNRFARTAALCDHVFTTDADRVPDYLALAGSHVQSVSTLPFYAQPAIHNPLPTARNFSRDVAFAGTFYGDRYKKRSDELEGLLRSAQPYGLTIYDRQADIPGSQYRFPDRLRDHVRGSLPYTEVVNSYKSHYVNLNVNSVADSPSMFSRRVVEIAACGGVVLSGPGRGVTEALGSAVPVVRNAQESAAYLDEWFTHPNSRLVEAWHQVRSIYRAHLVDHALGLIARTAGLAVSVEPLPAYGLIVREGDHDALCSIVAQSVLPTRVFVAEADLDGYSSLRQLGVGLGTHDDLADSTEDLQWIGLTTSRSARTHYEDLLIATRFGTWDRILVSGETTPSDGSVLVSFCDGDLDDSGLIARRLVAGVTLAALLNRIREPVESAISLHKPILRTEVAPQPGAIDASSQRKLRGPQTVLVAGHDLKFARDLIEGLTADGAIVITDEWASHNAHDEEKSKQLLSEADVVFCEWGLGNAVWYSQHVSDRQRLIVRVHSQELFRPYLARIDAERVSQFVFVSALIMKAAIESHGVPAIKSTIIFNAVDVDGLMLPKAPGAPRTLGLVGMVPRSKRFDLALDLLDATKARGGSFRLRVKGRMPDDYPWMKNRPAELEYFKIQMARVKEMNNVTPGTVIFDGYGDDMPDWYREIGFALSVSDFESFHFTIPDGVASGAVPVILPWPGADLIYPAAWLSGTVDEAADRIMNSTPLDADSAVIRDKFARDTIIGSLVTLVRDQGDPGGR